MDKNKDTPMFRRERSTKKIEQINVSEFSDISENKNDKDFYVPFELDDCIWQAVKNRDFAELKKIHDVVRLHPTKVSLDPVIDSIYRGAIHDYTCEEFNKLRETLPIDINRDIHIKTLGMCTPPTYHVDSLLNLTIDFRNKNLFEYLLEHKADSNHLSHDKKTPAQQLAKALKNNEEYFKREIDQENKNYLQTECNKIKEMQIILNKYTQKTQNVSLFSSNNKDAVPAHEEFQFNAGQKPGL